MMHSTFAAPMSVTASFGRRPAVIDQSAVLPKSTHEAKLTACVNGHEIKDKINQRVSRSPTSLTSAVSNLFATVLFTSAGHRRLNRKVPAGARPSPQELAEVRIDCAVNFELIGPMLLLPRQLDAIGSQRTPQSAMLQPHLHLRTVPPPTPSLPSRRPRHTTTASISHLYPLSVSSPSFLPNRSPSRCCYLHRVLRK